MARFPSTGPPLYPRGNDNFGYRGGFRGRGRGDYGGSERFPTQNGGFDNGSTGAFGGYSGFRGRSSFRPPMRGDAQFGGGRFLAGGSRPFGSFRGASRGADYRSSYAANESRTSTPSAVGGDIGSSRTYQGSFPHRAGGGNMIDRRGSGSGTTGMPTDPAAAALADENLYATLASLDDLAAGSAVNLTVKELSADISSADSSLLESDVLKTVLTQEASKRITLVEKVRASAKRSLDDQQSAYYNERSWPSVHLGDQWLRSTIEAKFRQYEQSLKKTAQLEHSVAAQVPALDPNTIQTVHDKATRLHELNERLREENEELAAFVTRGPLFRTKMVAQLARESAEILQPTAAAALRTAKAQDIVCEQQWKQVAALQNLLKQLGEIRAEQEKAVDKAVALTREAGCDRIAVAEVLRKNDPETLVSDASIAHGEQVFIDKYDAELQESVSQALTSLFGAESGNAEAGAADVKKEENVSVAVKNEESPNSYAAAANPMQQQVPPDAFLQMQHQQQMHQLMEQQHLQQQQQQQFLIYQQQQQYMHHQSHPFG